MMKYLLFLLVFFSVFFVGCFTEQKANRQINRIEQRYPILISNKCAKLFKPIVTKDTQIITEYINRIDTFLSINTDTLIVNDTIKIQSSKNVKKLFIYQCYLLLLGYNFVNATK